MKWLIGAAIVIAGLATATFAAADEASWQALREGRAVLLMRHATAPGLGDPPSFRLDDCTTQRNLDERGRAEARRWGDLLRANGIGSARLFSSRWCRARDTAQGMNLGEVRALPALDSFFEARERAGQQTAALREAVNALPAGAPVVLVSHQVNITALTGVFPRSGEALVLPLPLTESPKVLARIAAP